MNPPDAYIICATSRSGSTLLCRLLSDSGVAGKPDSYFHRPSVSAWERALGLPSLETSDERERLRHVLRAARLAGTGRTATFGLRLMRPSVDFLMACLRTLHPDLSGDAARIDAAFGRTAYIHLSRRDKVAQAVSLLKAQQSGLWHVAPDGTELERNAAPRPLAYDAELIARHVDELVSRDDDWERWFERERIAPVRVTYEALDIDPAGTLTRVLGSLGLDREAAKDVEPGVARLADATSRRWIERFRAERGTPSPR